jgi:putative transposase
MRYRFVAAERATFSVRVLCRIVGCAASGFYAWLRRRPDRRREDDRRLGEKIAAIFAASRCTYGSPRVHAELRDGGLRIGRGRVGRLMREAGLSVARRRRVPRTTDSRHDLPVAPNLLGRDFAADRPDTVWLADISYIPTGEGWLYLAAIKDMASREIVGWSMAGHLGADLACEALLMAIRRRQPPPGLIHHSDRGVQYASKPYRAILARHGITPSMSRKGDCLDNAPIGLGPIPRSDVSEADRESFFGSLKNELVHRTSFPSREAARRAIFEYVEAFYNRRRRHSAVGFLTPAQAYEQMARAA